MAGSTWRELAHRGQRIRRWGTVQVCAATLLEGRRVTLLHADAHASDRAVIDRIVARHVAVRHDEVPSVIAHGDGAGGPWVILSFAAVTDAARCVEAMLLPDHPYLSWEIATELCLVKLRSLHALNEQTGDTLGALGLCNVLVDADGRTSVLLADPPVDTPGAWVCREEVTETRFGGMPDRSTQATLGWAPVQRLAFLGGAPPRLLAVLSGEATPEDPVYRCVTPILRRLQAPVREDRFPTVVHATDAWAELWALLETQPDPAGLQAMWRWCLDRLPDAPSLGAITVSPAQVVLPDGSAVDLTEHPLLARLLTRLAEAWHLRPGAPVSPEELLGAGWPDERASRPSAFNRLWTALSRLRALGLGPFLQRVDGGYRLDPDVPVICGARQPAPGQP